MSRLGLTELRAAAAHRFQRWALDECAKEVGANFMHLKTIRSSWVLGVLEFIERWPPDDQLSMMQAQVITGERDAELSDRQRLLLKSVLDSTPSRYGPRYMQMLEDYAAGRFRVPRPALRRALKRYLTPIVGPPEQLQGAEWKHRIEVGKWTILTEIDSGGNGRQFELSHLVQFERSTLFWAAPTLWWGMGGPTLWDRVAADDVDGATGAAVALCEYFIAQVPEMLRDL